MLLRYRSDDSSDAGEEEEVNLASCFGFCGGGSADDSCFCDGSCEEFGDCCDDFCDACPDLGSCSGGRRKRRRRTGGGESAEGGETSETTEEETETESQECSPRQRGSNG